jgi:glycoside/pentoside/hexuronide:cation symporter, GPH family
MQDATQKVSLREKIGYSLGDSSANFVFQLMMMYQLFFYTQVFGIKAGVAGTILLLARVFDAFVDPLVGILSDRTDTKWGKYRPWIIWTALPFGLFYFLAFTTPDWAERAKIIYAGITYTLLMAIYSFINTPYSALLGVMSSDIKERTSIASVRFVFAMAAAFLVQGLTFPLVTILGNGKSDDPTGWSRSVGIFAILSVIFFVIAFFSAKERVKPPVDQKTSVRQDVKDLLKNKPWLAMFILTLFIFITLSLWGSSMSYFFNSYMDNNAIYAFLERFGLVNKMGGVYTWWHKFLNAFGLIAQADKSNAFAVGISFFNMAGQLITIIAVMTLSQPLAARFGKRNVFIVCLALTTLFTGLFIIVPPTSVGLAFLLNILKSLAYAPTIPLLWAMMADVADYSEWKNHRRATGFVFAGIVFSLKVGLGVGGAICGWILGSFGYLQNVAPDEKVLLGIRLTSSIFPAITFLIGVIALYTYTISKKVNEEIQQELSERRKSYS